MANTTFSGPVISTNGFSGGAITTTDVTASGDLSSAGGTVIFTNLPTSDPSVAGQLWSNAGVLTVSAG